MTNSNLTFGRITIGGLALFALSSFAMGGPIGTIDDFGDADLSQYTKSVVLEQSATNAISFASPAGVLQVSKAADDGAEQVVFLRDDYTLAIGETLRVDTAAPTATDYADFGIVVANSVDPPDAVWTAGTADARAGYAAVYLKAQTSGIGYFVANVGGGQLASSAGVGGVTFADVTGLYIRRTTSSVFDIGYSTALGDTSATTVDFMDGGVGAAVGLYADLRATHTYGDLDNLRIVASPVLGDVTGEGVIDINDFNVIKMNFFNTGQSRIQGDLTGDTIVNFDDFRQWKTAAGSGFASVTLFGVPEPTSGLLFTAGCIGFISLVRRRRLAR